MYSAYSTLHGEDVGVAIAEVVRESLGASRSQLGAYPIDHAVAEGAAARVIAEATRLAAHVRVHHRLLLHGQNGRKGAHHPRKAIITRAALSEDRRLVLLIAVIAQSVLLLVDLVEE